MLVNICGLPHRVIESEDNFDTECHLGMIDYKKCEIRINKNLSDELKQLTICHEMVHGILTHIGADEASNNEQFVQTLALAINQAFTVKTEGW